MQPGTTLRKGETAVTRAKCPVPASRAGLRDLTSFVGREKDLARVSALFETNASLVTVHGPPGMGKTRLARHWLLRAAETCGSLFFCDLRSAMTVQDLALEMGRVLQVRLDNASTSAGVVESIGQVLSAAGSCVVVLDNFEQLAPVAARTVVGWMRDAPQIRFLITSRRLLGVEAERVHELRPLRLPSTADDWDCESVTLFEARAKAAAPWFARDAVDPSEVTELVKRFDGIPLALELAAGQMRRRTPGELLRVLAHHSTSCVETIHQDVDPRHSTLEAALMGSWQLLDAVEREALAQLTVFRGGFDLDAVDAVLSVHQELPRRANIDIVMALCDAALLVRSGAHGVSRWDMYESVRDFAAGRISGDVGALRRRHAAHSLRVGEAWVADLTTSNGLRARRALRRESDNIQHAFAALSKAEDAEGREWLGRIALVLHAALRESMPALARGPLSCALAKTKQRRRGDRQRKAKLLVARAHVTSHTGNYRIALEDLRTARDLARGAGALEATVDLEMAETLHCAGSLSRARGCLEKALETAHSIGDAALEGRVHTSIAWLLAEGFRDSAGFTHYKNAVMHAAASGDVIGEAFARVGRCGHRIFFARGNPKDELQTLLETAKRHEDTLLEAYTLSALGIGAFDGSLFEEARAYLERAIFVAERAGMKRHVGMYTGWLAMALEESSQRWEAIAGYETAIRLLEDVGDLRSVERHQLLLAGALASDGDLEGAQELARHARSLVAGSEDSTLSELVSLAHGRISLARHKDAVQRGSMKDARQQSLRATKAKRSIKPTILEASPILRSQMRLFEREARASLEHPVLRVWPDGAAFQLGAQPVVDLPSGPSMALRRVLWTLAETRRHSPGQPLSVDALIAAGWPGERVMPKAASMRVRNAVLRLRRAGLVGVLRTNPDGYLLDVSVPLVPPV